MRTKNIKLKNNYYIRLGRTLNIHQYYYKKNYIQGCYNILKQFCFMLFNLKTMYFNYHQYQMQMNFRFFSDDIITTREEELYIHCTDSVIQMFLGNFHNQTALLTNFFNRKEHGFKQSFLTLFQSLQI